MASLKELLAEEGLRYKEFLKGNNGKKNSAKGRDKVGASEGVTLPIHICNDQRTVVSLKQKREKASARKGPSSLSSKRLSSEYSERSSVINSSVKADEPLIDDAAIKAVVSILSGYVGRYKNDGSFREMIREKCNSCLVRRINESDNGVFVNIELGIESIEKLVEDGGTRKELKMKSLRNSIQLLSVVASLNSKTSRKGSTCGVPNSHLSACAQLYLSIVYKLEKNDRISARHLLQVFCDAPFLARTHLLPDLWEHFFLPHLLHLKVWYHRELEFLSISQYIEKEKKMKGLAKLYNDQVDMGTIQFALYYKQWLKVGTKAPQVPDVPLPARPCYAPSRRRSSDSYTSNSSSSRNLYKIVFGSNPDRRSMDMNSQNKASSKSWNLEGENLGSEEYSSSNYMPTKTRSHRRSSSQNYTTRNDDLLSTQKSNYLKLLPCQSALSECTVSSNRIVRSISVVNHENNDVHPLSNLSRAIRTICSSESLTECEKAIHVIARAWLYSSGNPVTEVSISKAPVIEGILEVLFASEDDEILELGISILAELVSRNEANGLIILNSDPQLESFTRLLKSSSLFLKASVLLHLVKPKAKQMISTEWVALVLRVLEFGDQLQILFTVRCYPLQAAMYFLDQLLTGFDEDRNLENASQVVSLGGLSLLARRFERGNIDEKNNAAILMSCCIQADGSCRNYLAKNLFKASFLELIVHGIQNKENGWALSLLTELLCLSRRTEILEVLTRLDEGWEGMKTKHILLIYLMRASLEERPLVAAILLQLDVLGDPFKSSLYREEAVEAIIQSLDSHDSKIQEQSAKALVMLGGRFSHSGEATSEEWFLQRSGTNEEPVQLFCGKEIASEDMIKEEDAMADWKRKVAIVLLNTGGERFLAALSNSIAIGIPSLAQASLFTVEWLNRILHSEGNEGCQTTTNSKRVNAPFPLQHLIKNSACVSMLSLLDKELIDPLRNSSLHGQP